MTFTIRFLLSVALVGVVSLLGSGTALGPGAARAQTATDLKCTRCVDTREIDRKAINRSRLRNGAVNLRKLQPRLGKRANSTQPFYVTLDTFAQKTVIRHGPLSIFIRCSIAEAGNDFIRIFATSSVGGWVTGDSPGPFVAGQEILVDSFFTSAGTVFVTNHTDGDTIVAPGGFMLSFADDSNFIALNTLGHRCTYAGIFFVVSEN